jgi:hypothetical protein
VILLGKGATDTVAIPIWLGAAAVVAAALLALLGVLIGHRVTRKGTKEMDNRGKREELLRTVRWAGEMILRGNMGIALAAATLAAVQDSPLLQEPSDQAFIDAILGASIEEPVEAYYEADPDEEGPDD